MEVLRYAQPINMAMAISIIWVSISRMKSGTIHFHHLSSLMPASAQSTGAKDDENPITPKAACRSSGRNGTSRALRLPRHSGW